MVEAQGTEEREAARVMVTMNLRMTFLIKTTLVGVGSPVHGALRPE